MLNLNSSFTLESELLDLRLNSYSDLLVGAERKLDSYIFFQVSSIMSKVRAEVCLAVPPDVCLDGCMGSTPRLDNSTSERVCVIVWSHHHAIPRHMTFHLSRLIHGFRSSVFHALTLTYLLR